jgi:hypothetical protein
VNVLGLDISTAIVGYCLFKNGKLDSAGSIKLSNKKCMFEKAEAVEKALLKIATQNIDRVLIEENLQSFRSGFSSAKTISTLAKFNGIVSYLSSKIFDVKPEFINVNHARKVCGIKIDRKNTKNTKEQVLDWVKQNKNFSNFTWPTKTLKSGPRKGMTILKQDCFDIADAAVLCIYTLN